MPKRNSDKIWVIVLVLFVIYYIFTSFGPSTLYPRGLAAPFDPKEPDPCVTKKKCLIVYVTPWCPACNSSEALIKRIRDDFKNSPEYGMMIVIGVASQPELAGKALDLGENTFLDTENKFRKAAKIYAYPTWMVVDQNYNILSRMTGGYRSYSESIRQELFRRLKIN